MAKELGAGNAYPGILNKLAQYEVALLKFMEANLGASEYGIFANNAGRRSRSISGSCPATSTRGWPRAASRSPARWISTAR